MIAISSHRRLSDSEEIARNQIRAHQSWLGVFDEILFFGAPEPELTSPNTAFITSEDFPLISSLAMAASMGDDFACLINADIVVTEKLRSALNDVWKRGGVAATSKRYQFGGDGYDKAEIVDQGIDFFWASPDLWRKVAYTIPAHFRIGHSAWDTWTMSYFNTTVGRWFYDITKRRCVFHPEHQNRKRVHHIKPVDDKYTMNCGFPYLKL